jgi:LAGLIDADG endonuclease
MLSCILLINTNKLYSMWETLQLIIMIIIIINIRKYYYLFIFLRVRMFFLFLFIYNFKYLKFINYILYIYRWRLSTWKINKYLFIFHQRLYVEHLKFNINMFDHSKSINLSNLYTKDNFYQWLVGFTDGNGCFSFYNYISNIKKYKWTLTFKISQSNYNIRILYLIKKQLGYGSIYIEKTTNNAHFVIKNKKVIEKIILPIFDKYPLLTNKQYDYFKFRKAHSILTNSSLSIDMKNKIFLYLKNKNKPDNYISPIWNKINNTINNTNEAKSIISKWWLIGFTEAKGSFYIVKKDPYRLVHRFEITQKLDIILLIGIAKILGISVKNKKVYNTIGTTNSRAIKNIIDYYENTMKGMKSLEYKVWAKSFLKYKGNYIELNKTIDIMSKIRCIKLGKIK